ncbi:MAG: hypothetical protein WA001_02565 [Patescibacteria group bacterium]
MAPQAKLRLKTFWYGAIFGPLFFLVLAAIDRLLLLVPTNIADALNTWIIALYPPTSILDLVIYVSTSAWLAWAWSLLVFAVYYGLLFVVVAEAYRLFIGKRRIHG